MHDKLKALALKLLRVPPEPEAPAGAPESIRVFRAGRNFYRLNLWKWAISQVAAVVVVLVALHIGLAVVPQAAAKTLAKSKLRFLSSRLASLAVTVIHFAELAGLAGLAAQSPFTFFLVRLDYEMRWYIVTDRSLRLRHGLMRVREMTMTHANIQQISIQQGPLQRLLGIEDLKVRTAGGGADGSSEDTEQDADLESMHVAYFRGVENAGLIRDLIQGYLRRRPDAGLGDPDDRRAGAAAAGAVETEPSAATARGGHSDRVITRELLAAARELRHEAQLLRQAAAN